VWLYNYGLSSLTLLAFVLPARPTRYSLWRFPSENGSHVHFLATAEVDSSSDGVCTPHSVLAVLWPHPLNHMWGYLSVGQRRSINIHVIKLVQLQGTHVSAREFLPRPVVPALESSELNLLGNWRNPLFIMSCLCLPGRFYTVLGYYCRLNSR
jgi:hypothetical protein